MDTDEKESQMEKNIRAYATSFDLCLKRATEIVDRQKPKKESDLDLDRQEIADSMFQRFWDDQRAEQDRKMEMKRAGLTANATAGALQNLRGGIY